MGETTARRLKQIMDMRGLKQVDVIKMCQPYCKLGAKFGKSDMSQYLSGKVEPSLHKLSILSQALNVQEAWLMGQDVPMERKSNPSPISDSELKFALFNAQDGITDEMLEEVKQFADYIMNKKS